MTMSTTIAGSLALAATLLSVSCPAVAQEKYPARPVTLVVGFAAALAAVGPALAMFAVPLFALMLALRLRRRSRAV